MGLWNNRPFVLLFSGTIVALFIGYFVNISSIQSYSNMLNNFDYSPWKMGEISAKHNGTFDDNPGWFHDRITRTAVGLAGDDTNITKIKKILYWNPGFAGQMNMMEPGGTKWFQNVGCPVWQCDIVRSWDTNSSQTIKEEDYDAVIFFDPTWADVSQRPAKRSPHQHYVWLTYEAPGYHTYVSKWSESSEFFNWTITYRWDSDFVAPYGYFRPLLSNETAPQKKNYAEGKSKMAIWFVTNCEGAKNGRFDYVKRLQRHMEVDIYGACSSLKCPHGKMRECQAMMERDYKFVIAFENSLCLDYMSERFYYNMKFNIIPIVLDLHSNAARFAPAGSYINALDFSSVKELADYLKVLDGNDTLYNQYFEWKQHYVIETSDVLAKNTNPARFRDICRLCSILHDPSRPVNVVKNLTKWWNDEAKCKVLKFPSKDEVESGRWIAQDYDPPYYSEPWRPGTFGSG